MRAFLTSLEQAEATDEIEVDAIQTQNIVESKRVSRKNAIAKLGLGAGVLLLGTAVVMAL